jgi:hypothetical protein
MMEQQAVEPRSGKAKLKREKAKWAAAEALQACIPPDQADL